MTHRKFIIIAALALLLSAGRAEAQGLFYPSTNLNLRAGPGGNYPVLDTVGPQSTLQILGCLTGWTWCDVNAGGNRGWVSGDYLRGRQNNNAYPLAAIASAMGLPTVGFDQDTYWGNYYSDRDFYRKRYPNYAVKRHSSWNAWERERWRQREQWEADRRRDEARRAEEARKRAARLESERRAAWQRAHRNDHRKPHHDNGLHRGWYKDGHHDKKGHDKDRHDRDRHDNDRHDNDYRSRHHGDYND